MAPGKFDDDALAGARPRLVADDPYFELFADCTTPEQVLELQREIEESERE
jgi:hypothetical protein